MTMTRRRAGGLLLAVLLGGCQKLGAVGDVLETAKPTVSFQKLDVDSLDFSGIQSTLVFRVDNPNPVQLALASLDYTFSLEGQRVVSGDQADGLTLPAQGHGSVRIPVALAFADLPELLSQTRGKDALAFAVQGTMGFQTPLGVVTLPYNATGDLPVLRAPKIAFSKLRVESLSVRDDRATLALDLDVTHTGGASIGLKDMQYALSLSRTEVADGKVASLGQVDSSGTQTVTIPLNLRLTGLGSALISALTERTPVQARLAADLKVETPYGAIPLSIDESGQLTVR